MSVFKRSQNKKQKIPGNPLASGEMNSANSASQPEQTPSTDISLTCKTMMLDAFIEAYCNDKDVPDNWMEILMEWSELMQNDNAKRAFEIADKILRLTSHIKFVKECLRYFRMCLRMKLPHDEEVEALLNELYSCDVRSAASLNMVRSMVKTRFYELSVLTDEENRIKGETAGERMTEGDFNKDIHHLAKFQGYAINKKETSVSDYAAIYNNFIESIKQKG